MERISVVGKVYSARARLLKGLLSGYGELFLRAGVLWMLDRLINDGSTSRSNS